MNNKDNINELEQLRADYNSLKEELNKQIEFNSNILRDMKMKTSREINKEMKKRIRMNITSIPMIWLICIPNDWPVLFAVLVSAWCIFDLGVTLWVNKKLNLGNFLDDNVLKATHKINLYHKFFYGTFAASLVITPIMLVYIFGTLVEKSGNPNTIQWIVVSGIIFSLVFIVSSIRFYRKHMEKYNEMMSQFKEQ